MIKTYKIEVDCANCANLIEAKAARVEGIEALTISHMTQKMIVTFSENTDTEAVIAQVLRVAKKIDSDFKILQ